MGQEDYLKRQFDQLGKALGRILASLIALRDEGETLEVLEFTNRALKKELNLDIDQLLAIPQEKFIHLFKEDEKLKSKHLEKLGNIFYQLADLMDQQDLDGEKKMSLYERSSVIYEYLNTTGSVYSLERQFLINKIRKMLR